MANRIWIKFPILVVRVMNSTWVKKCSISNWISASLLLKGVNIELKKNSFQKIYRPFSQINMNKFQEMARETAYLWNHAILFVQWELIFLILIFISFSDRVTQTQIKKSVDVESAEKAFELNLPQFGPYTIDYTRNGRFVALGGRKGHVAAIDWQVRIFKFLENYWHLIWQFCNSHTECCDQDSQFTLFYPHFSNGSLGQLVPVKSKRSIFQTFFFRVFFFS